MLPGCRSCLAPGTGAELRGGQGGPGAGSADGAHGGAGGRPEMPRQMTGEPGEGRSVCACAGGRREEGRGDRGGERGGEREQQKARREGAGEGGREGERRKEEREGEREGGESWLLALSLPLSPALCRCRSAPLRLTGGEGGGEGGAFGAGGGRKDGGVRPSALTGAARSQRRAGVQTASCLRGGEGGHGGCRGGRFQSSRRCGGCGRRGEPQLSSEGAGRKVPSGRAAGTGPGAPLRASAAVS